MGAHDLHSCKTSKDPRGKTSPRRQQPADRPKRPKSAALEPEPLPPLGSRGCALCDATGPALKCARCKTAYCSPACQRKHWKAGHKGACEAISILGLETYRADTTAAMAAERAAAACAAKLSDPRLRCYACGAGGELVRGCGCSGPVGCAHVPCLAAAARAATEASPEHLGSWHTCRLCHREYRGAVQLALARECWRTYAGADPQTLRRVFAMNALGGALAAAGEHAEALRVREAELAVCRRYFGGSDAAVLSIQGNLASCYRALGRVRESVALHREVYARRAVVFGASHDSTLHAAKALSTALDDAGLHADREALLRDALPRCRAALGGDHLTTITVGAYLARAITRGAATRVVSDRAIAEAEQLLTQCRDDAAAAFGADSATTASMTRHLEETIALYLA